MSKIPVPQQWNAKLDQPITPAAQQFLNAVADNSGGGVTDAEYILNAPDADLPNSLVLTAGTNITLTPAAGLLTIAASGGGGGGAQIWFGTTPPTDPVAYPIWWRTSAPGAGNSYFYYDDGDTTQWVGPSSVVGPAGTNGTNGTNGTDGVGVPVGGTAGQVLAKIDATNYNTTWVDQSGGGGAANINNYFC